VRLVDRLRQRWVLTGAGAVLLACVAVTVVVVRAGGAACAAPAAAKIAGKATFYAATGAGNCSFDALSAPLVVALGPAEYRAGAACGGYLDVTGPKGSVRVKVVDRCPECAAGHIDLSQEAFTRIGSPTDGIVPVSYRTVTGPGVPGPLTVRVKEGSSAYWLALRFDNHGNALTSAELKVGSAWQKLQRTDFNYWIDENGAGGGPFTVRLTDASGRQTVVPAIKLAPEQVQRTGVSMYSGGAAQAATPAPSKSTPPAASASASAGAASAEPSAGTGSGTGSADATDQAAGAGQPPVRVSNTCD
jgi:expansin (peptidoglycan-binding protein)